MMLCRYKRERRKAKISNAKEPEDCYRHLNLLTRFECILGDSLRQVTGEDLKGNDWL